MTDCSICGEKIPSDDFEIKRHLIEHEYKWVQTLRGLYEV